MENQKLIQILIYFHALFGGIALLSGLLALLFRKGKNTHKKTGKLFYYAMLLSAITALIISTLPNHQSPFLFSIGIFSSYFVLTGYRALQFKDKNPNLKIDRAISRIMILTGILMIFYAPLVYQKINIILTVFGIVGLIFSSRDLILYKNEAKLQKVWLKLHLGKMLGGYISATTAFVVVNDFFSSIYGWFVPGIIGGFYIVYWIKKLNKQEEQLLLKWK